MTLKLVALTKVSSLLVSTCDVSWHFLKRGDEKRRTFAFWPKNGVTKNKQLNNCLPSYLQKVFEGLGGHPWGWLLACSSFCPSSDYRRPADLQPSFERSLFQHPEGKVSDRGDLAGLVSDDALEQLEEAPQRSLNGGVFLGGGFL